MRAATSCPSCPLFLQFVFGCFFFKAFLVKFTYAIVGTFKSGKKSEFNGEIQPILLLPPGNY